jgi:hypothetical protein
MSDRLQQRAGEVRSVRASDGGIVTSHTDVMGPRLAVAGQAQDQLSTVTRKPERFNLPGNSKCSAAFSLWRKGEGGCRQSDPGSPYLSYPFVNLSR